jgi:hypothetical protein
MSKTYFIYILLIFLPLLSLGQWQLGGRAGTIVYSFTHPDEGGENAEYGYPGFPFSISVTARQNTAKTFNPGIELEYTNRSFSVSASEFGHVYSSHTNLSYTLGNLYLHFQPRFVFGKSVKFFFYPGFYFGTFLHSSVNGTINSSTGNYPPYSTTQSINGSAKGYYPQFEFGISPGAGLEVPFHNNFNLDIEYQFTWGLIPVGYGWGYDAVRMLGMNLKIGVAYTFLKVQ